MSLWPHEAGFHFGNVEPQNPLLSFCPSQPRLFQIKSPHQPHSTTLNPPPQPSPNIHLFFSEDILLAASVSFYGLFPSFLSPSLGRFCSPSAIFDISLRGYHIEKFFSSFVCMLMKASLCIVIFLSLFEVHIFFFLFFLVFHLFDTLIPCFFLNDDESFDDALVPFQCLVYCFLRFSSIL